MKVEPDDGGTEAAGAPRLGNRHTGAGMKTTALADTSNTWSPMPTRAFPPPSEPVSAVEPQTPEDAQEEGDYVNWHRDHGNDEAWRYLPHQG